jgi:hypothetical protein
MTVLNYVQITTVRTGSTGNNTLLVNIGWIQYSRDDNEKKTRKALTGAQGFVDRKRMLGRQRKTIGKILSKKNDEYDHGKTVGTVLTFMERKILDMTRWVVLSVQLACKRATFFKKKINPALVFKTCLLTIFVSQILLRPLKGTLP